MYFKITTCNCPNKAISLFSNLSFFFLFWMKKVSCWTSNAAQTAQQQAQKKYLEVSDKICVLYSISIARTQRHTHTCIRTSRSSYYKGGLFLMLVTLCFDYYYYFSIQIRWRRAGARSLAFSCMLIGNRLVCRQSVLYLILWLSSRNVWLITIEQIIVAFLCALLGLIYERRLRCVSLCWYFYFWILLFQLLPFVWLSFVYLYVLVLKIDNFCANKFCLLKQIDTIRTCSFVTANRYK